MSNIFFIDFAFFLDFRDFSRFFRFRPKFAVAVNILHLADFAGGMRFRRDGSGILCVGN